jgi:4'-phosphopantetheinyl transferase
MVKILFIQFPIRYFKLYIVNSILNFNFAKFQFCKMPLVINKSVDENTILIVWHITESIDYFKENSILNDNSTLRLQNMKSESHQKGYLAVRMLLQQIGYQDHDLYYKPDGKPYLKDQMNISISHSFEYSSIIISNKFIGIDIEKHKEKIKKIDYKFAEHEMKFLEQNCSNYIEYLTVIWGVKEAIFKIMNIPGISFNNHIILEPFKLENKKGEVTLDFNKKISKFTFNIISLPNYSLVYIIK